MLDGRDVAEEVTAADEEKYPHYGTDDIVMSKGQVVHLADARNEGAKVRTIGTKRARKIAL